MQGDMHAKTLAGYLDWEVKAQENIPKSHQLADWDQQYWKD